MNDLGPEGARGETGAPGEMGDPGAPGRQGSAGTSDPAAGIQNQAAAAQAASFDVTGSAIVEGGHYLTGGDGDANADGAITVADRSAVSAYLIGKLDLTPVQQQRADVDGDGLVTPFDRDRITDLIAGVPLETVQLEGKRLLGRVRDGLGGGDGDLDDDGERTASDLSLISGWLNGTTTLTPTQRVRADMNGDRRVNRIDLEMLAAAVQAELGVGAPVTVAAGKHAAENALDVNLAGFPMLGKRLTSAPPGKDCNANAIGAVALDTANATLYVCVTAGWRKKVLAP
ncbi:MAG TPA: dockerin type I domain-containing protein [Kofleriaceae bacterium]|nr:dockerin type I domain-containing protein [Kofleriaceae bacterium]